MCEEMVLLEGAQIHLGTCLFVIRSRGSLFWSIFQLLDAWNPANKLTYIPNALKYGFCKKLLRYKWTSVQLNTFVFIFFPDQCWSGADLEKKWRQKCSTGQRFICTEITSYKIHILKDAVLMLGVNLRLCLLSLCFWTVNVQKTFRSHLC